MLEELRNAQNRVVGTKQVLRALETGKLNRVYVANDADEFIYRRVMLAAEQAGAQVVRVETMKELGQACKVEVKTAAAGLCR